MMEDTQSMTGFGGPVRNVVFPGKIMADSEKGSKEVRYKVMEKHHSGEGYKKIS